QHPAAVPETGGNVRAGRPPGPDRAGSSRARRCVVGTNVPLPCCSSAYIPYVIGRVLCGAVKKAARLPGPGERQDNGPHPLRRHLGVAVLLVLLLGFGLALSPAVRAATRTWTGLGPTNNWTDAANWAGNILPGAADIATFDATGAKPATINAAINVAGISIAATYAGTITQAAAVTVGASGFSQSGGAFVGGAAA